MLRLAEPGAAAETAAASPAVATNTTRATGASARFIEIPFLDLTQGDYPGGCRTETGNPAARMRARLAEKALELVEAVAPALPMQSETGLGFERRLGQARVGRIAGLAEREADRVLDVIG